MAAMYPVAYMGRCSDLRGSASSKEPTGATWARDRRGLPESTMNTGVRLRPSHGHIEAFVCTAPVRARASEGASSLHPGCRPYPRYPVAPTRATSLYRLAPNSASRRAASFFLRPKGPGVPTKGIFSAWEFVENRSGGLTEKKREMGAFSHKTHLFAKGGLVNTVSRTYLQNNQWPSWIPLRIRWP
jgi:hypothetical protein